MSINSKTIARSLAVEKSIDAKTSLRNRNARGWQRDSFQRIRGYDLNDNVDSTAPYFVRSWAPKLDNLAGESSADVDWRHSFYLNLIAHSSYTATVAICSQQVLRNHQAG